MRTDISKINRRKFLLSAVGATAVGVAGLSWSRYAGSAERWVERIVRDNLRDVTLDETTLSQFVNEVLAGDLFAPRTHRWAVFAGQSVPWITARIPKVRDGLDKLERRVLTEYLIGSNFFRVPDPKRETIVYYGRAIACINPFVTFG